MRQERGRVILTERVWVKRNGYEEGQGYTEASKMVGLKGDEDPDKS